MKRAFVLVSLSIICLQGYSQTQLEIDRVSLMPDFPTPYIMRDWKTVARDYDSEVFDLDAQGEHLPITSIGSQGFNYPELQPILMDTYVGTPTSGAEAINIIPAVVGASLMGIDKSNQSGFNWVESIKDFYNVRNGENIYLNNPSGRSGDDWWYETMPNVFFYQLYSQYPTTSDFELQFRSVADQWLEAVYAMGGSTAPWTVPQMNYRAWDVKNDIPLDEGVPEPEAAGAIAWLLYQAYEELGDKKYLIGAQLVLDFLEDWPSNPSYELQLPYGVLSAAKMNARLGTTYDIDKMINWCFDRGELRGWGSVVGTWDDQDVSGLIGEANDGGNDYVFLMNGLQQAAALAPLVKYDKRYAAAIAKWILNLANASRLFYPGHIDPSQQSDYDWSSQYDPQGVIGYEAIKERWQGVDLFARGDSKDAGWAATNLALYGSSHVGYLAAIVDETDQQGILLLDVNATDFFADKPFPTYLVYNPHDEVRQVTIPVGEESVDVYDAIGEQVIASGVSGSLSVSLDSKAVMLLSYLPTGNEPEAVDGRLMTDDDVIDWHYGYNFSGRPYLKALSAQSPIGETGVENVFYATVTPDEGASFAWYLDGILQGSDSSVLTWTPTAVGTFSVKMTATIESHVLADSLAIEVRDIVPERPVIESVSADKKWYRPGEEVNLSAIATDPKGLSLAYTWSINEGQILEEMGEMARGKLPEQSGIYTATLTVTNSFDSTATKELALLVREEVGDQEPLIYLPMDGSVIDRSDNNWLVTVSQPSFGLDAKDDAGRALSLSNAGDEVSIENSNDLNFADAITVSFWAFITDFSEERFAVSHGGWEQRWKASVTTERHLRWTVNTPDGIKDLDSSFPLEDDTYYHFALVYTGFGMELYVNGELDVFSDHSGVLNISNADLAIGKRLPGDDRYFWKGKLDEVKVFDTVLDPNQIAGLPTLWSNQSPLGTNSWSLTRAPYPNPTSRTLHLESHETITSVKLINLSGQIVLEMTPQRSAKDRCTLVLDQVKPGLYLLQIGSEPIRWKVLVSNN
ncbi:MAG: LamG-like jellyroll fold domain-containing protein [Cyclobacteriaceae bacterium]